MLRKKIHAHLSHHKKTSSHEEGFIANDFRNIMNKRSLFTNSFMNKNEKLIMGILVSGIIVFLAISIILLFGNANNNVSSLLPTSTLGPTKKVNLTPYPTIPPVKDTTVMVNERMFNPPKTSINRGNSIDFLNISDKPMTIEANDSNSSLLNIGTIASGDDKFIQFTVAGTYTYRNKDNPKETGIIIIE
jgi:plastocyanin